jgi:hypothetical protein
MARRAPRKFGGIGAVILALLSLTGKTVFAQSTLGWDKTFPASPLVAHQ